MFNDALFRSLPDGEEKMKYLKKQIDKADKEQDDFMSLNLRYLYIKESVFNGDCYKAVIMFPEYMSIFDRLTEVDSDDIHFFMTAFKWIIEDVKDFYQMSKEMAEYYFEEFRNRCERYGFSLRTYYMKKMLFYSDIDPEKAKELCEKFRQAERDELSDCEACEMNHDICMEFLFGTEEKAISMLEEMKTLGISCGEVPEVTYGKCVEHFTKIGAISEAEHYANLLMPMIKDNDNFLMEISHILLLRSFTDPDKALSVFTRYLDFYIRSRNPKMRFYFADAAAKFFKALSKLGFNEISITLPDSFERYSDDDLYDVSELSDYFYSKAKKLAEKFDNRNGNSHFTDTLNYLYPEVPLKELKLPRHSTAQRTPLVIGVPFKLPDNFPARDDMYDAVNSIEGIVIEDSDIDEETSTLIFKLADKEGGSSVRIEAQLAPIESDMERFNYVHLIKQEEYDILTSEYGCMLVICAHSDELPSDELFLMLLKLATELNADDSPILLELVNFRFLSSRWAEVLTEVDVPLLDNLLYRTHVFALKDEEKLHLLTTGLSCFGSRQLTVHNADEENIDHIVKVMCQICGYVTTVGNMPDENTEVPFGVVYNDESQVLFGWKLPSSVYDDCEEFEDDEFAVPYISFVKDEEVVTLLLNELVAQDAEQFIFRDSSRVNEKKYAFSNATFKRVVRAIPKTSTLIAGFTVDVPEQYREEYGRVADIFVKVVCDGEVFKGVIDSGVNEIPELSDGAEITLSGDEYVFFWRIEDEDGEVYFPDEAYLFI